MDVDIKGGKIRIKKDEGYEPTYIYLSDKEAAEMLDKVENALDKVQDNENSNCSHKECENEKLSRNETHDACSDCMFASKTNGVCNECGTKVRSNE